MQNTTILLDKILHTFLFTHKILQQQISRLQKTPLLNPDHRVTQKKKIKKKIMSIPESTMVVGAKTEKTKTENPSEFITLLGAQLHYLLIFAIFVRVDLVLICHEPFSRYTVSGTPRITACPFP